ncbi:hypothetical protein N0V90_009626 [Kalmusia sp. IMI 367209]|nr:hypothetical protein N0V90_009626 [Kalmusia sp. IMI 367209]
MDSVNIAQFLEATYPDPPLPLTSELGRQIEVKARAVVGRAFRVSVEPRELSVISPRAQEYFRRGREAALGHSLEALLDTEEQVWKEVEGDAQAVGELMRTNKADGPFVLGKEPSMTDFFIAGALQNARVVHESVFEMMMKYPGYGEIYRACLPWMEKKD